MVITSLSKASPASAIMSQLSCPLANNESRPPQGILEENLVEASTSKNNNVLRTVGASCRTATH
eukprot:6123817-Amphidinium_carterae.1